MVQNALFASKAVATKSGSASVSARCVREELCTSRGADSELVSPQCLCKLLYACAHKRLPSESAQQARSGDGAHTATSLPQGREL